MFSVLARAEAILRTRGIILDSVEKTRESSGQVSFQKVAVRMISAKVAPPYFPAARVRQKMTAWKLIGIPAHMESRFFRNLAIISKWCHPKVSAVYFRTVWGGWVTEESMKDLIKKSGGTCRGCVLGCGWDKDAVEHYGRCKVFWEFLALPRSGGLGIPIQWRSADSFLLLSDMAEENKVRIAVGMYALYRTVQSLRHNNDDGTVDIKALMRIWVRKAAHRSKAVTLLPP